MRRLLAFAIALVFASGLSSPAAAGGSTGWKIYTYNPSGRALDSHEAIGDQAFTFLSTPDDALFATQRPEGPHVSLVGRTITASIRIDAPDGTTFQYYGQPDECGTPASVRLYFSSNGPMGTNKDWFSNFWWAHGTGSQVLKDGTFDLIVTLDPANWSNWNGKSGTAMPDGFAAAAADPDLIGFSFGGGCFFENGVGATVPGDGSATFTVLDLTISPSGE